MPTDPTKEYICLDNLNLYDLPEFLKLATQVAKTRHLVILEQSREYARVRLCEDDYKGYLASRDFNKIKESTKPYQAVVIQRAQIEKHLLEVINFTQLARKQDNYYLWGGTVGPNYDCSGLIQAAFASVGIWLPRDSYQQEEFARKITKEQLIAGDLIFFGSPRINHVALYLGYGSYIHSSGGRNRIEIDQLSDDGDEVSQKYYSQIVSYGRIEQSYQPTSLT